MRIAAISDVHGNLPALNAVLEDIAARRVDLIVNLGDALSGPLLPKETADRLIPLALPTIAGNHERQLLTLPSENQNLSDRFTGSVLLPEHKTWLSSLPETLFPVEGLLLVHGTPDSDSKYLLETVERHGLRETTPDELKLRMERVKAEITLCGHSHLPRVVALEDGRLIVNPGSVGLQAYEASTPFPHKVENVSPHARYAIVEKRAGNWRCEMITVEYDWGSMAVLAESRGRPDWARALQTGCV